MSVALGDDLARMVGIVQIDRDDASEGSVPVGQQVERPRDRGDRFVARIGGVEERPN